MVPEAAARDEGRLLNLVEHCTVDGERWSGRSNLWEFSENIPSKVLWARMYFEVSKLSLGEEGEYGYSVLPNLQYVPVALPLVLQMRWDT